MTLDQKMCDGCGEDATHRELYNPSTGKNEQVLMCDECFNYWSSHDGQQSALQDAIENAERRAGWDANP